MLRMIGWRLLQVVPTLVVATFIIFALVQIIPGDPATQMAGEGATPERIEQIRTELGLDQPIVVQYAQWLGDAAQGDLGTSLRANRPVLESVLDRFQVTGQLVFVAVLIAGALGVPFGILAAVRREKWSGKLTRAAAAIGIAIPNFWLAMILVVLFALTLGWFPATGWVGFADAPVQSLRHTLLPAIALSTIGVAEVTRQTASAMTIALTSDAARTHLAKGIRWRRIIQHALKNAGVPILTVISLLVSRFLGATVVIEVVFNLPGAGRLVVEAISWRDFPVVQGVVFVMVLVVLAVNLIADLGYRVLDPRIK